MFRGVYMVYIWCVYMYKGCIYHGRYKYGNKGVYRVYTGCNRMLTHDSSIFKEEAADYTSSTIRRKEELLESQKRAFHDTNNR